MIGSDGDRILRSENHMVKLQQRRTEGLTVKIAVPEEPRICLYHQTGLIGTTLRMTSTSVTGNGRMRKAGKEFDSLLAEYTALLAVVPDASLSSNLYQRIRKKINAHIDDATECPIGVVPIIGYGKWKYVDNTTKKKYETQVRTWHDLMELIQQDITEYMDKFLVKPLPNWEPIGYGLVSIDKDGRVRHKKNRGKRPGRHLKWGVHSATVFAEHPPWTAEDEMEISAYCAYLGLFAASLKDYAQDEYPELDWTDWCALAITLAWEYKKISVATIDSKRYLTEGGLAEDVPKYIGIGLSRFYNDMCPPRGMLTFNICAAPFLIRQGALTIELKVKNETARRADQAREMLEERSQHPIPEIGSVGDIYFLPAKSVSADCFHFPMPYSVMPGHTSKYSCAFEYPIQEQWTKSKPIAMGRENEEGDKGIEPGPDQVVRVRFVAETASQILHRVVSKTPQIAFKFPKNHDEVLDITGKRIDYTDPKNWFTPGSHVLALLSNAKEIMKDGIPAHFLLCEPITVEPREVIVDGVRKLAYRVPGANWTGYADPAVSTTTFDEKPMVLESQEDLVMQEFRRKYGDFKYDNGVFFPSTKKQKPQVKSGTPIDDRKQMQEALRGGNRKGKSKGKGKK
jgi:hypothetical protein